MGRVRTCVPPFIIKQPSITLSPSTNVVVSGNFKITIVAVGSPNLNYLWKRNGVKILNHNLPYIDIINAKETDFGMYTCKVYNWCGKVISDSLIVSNPNVFGMLVAGTFTISEKIDLLNTYKCKYARFSVDSDTWSGSSSTYISYVAAGFKTVLNVVNHRPTEGPVEFETDMTAYGAYISSVLDIIKADLVTIENEETNIGEESSYFSDEDFTGYINMLKTAIPICHNLGLKVTNGGITQRFIFAAIYRNYVAKNMAEKAEDFLINNVPANQWSNIRNPGNSAFLEQYLDALEILLNYYNVSELDYVNFHIYEPANTGQVATGDDVSDPTPDSINEIVLYLKEKTNKQIIMTEVGQKNLNPVLTQNILQKTIDNGFTFVIWYDGDDPDEINSVALNDSDGTIRVTGTAFTDFMTNKGF